MALASLLTILFIAMFVQPSIANATTFSFGYNRDSGQPGEAIGLNAASGCPATGNPWTVEAVLTDSANNVWTSAIATTTSGGLWYGGVMVINTNAAIGWGSLTLRCGGAGTIPVNQYNTIDFRVTQQATQISMSTAKVGKEVTFSSTAGQGCPANERMAISVYGTTQTSANGLEPLVSAGGLSDANGNWSVELALDVTKFNPGGTYYARAECWYESKVYPSLKFSPAARSYVALGDSFSSGEGAFNYYSNSGACHRSPDSYPAYLSNVNKLELAEFAACSGAVTDDLFNENAFTPPLPAQFNSLDESTDIVTLTIGGNDAGFGDIMDDCISRMSYSGDNCSTRSSITSLLASRLSKLAGTTSGTVYAPGTNNPIHSLHDVLTKIAEDAPNAKIYIAGYPKFFGASSSNYTAESNTPGGYKCSVWGAGIASVSYTDAQWLNDKSDELNGIIYDAVADLQLMNRFTFVPATLFDGHGLCDSSTSYMNGVHSDVTFNPTNESMHPNVSGMEFGYGAGFSQLIN